MAGSPSSGSPKEPSEQSPTAGSSPTALKDRLAQVFATALRADRFDEQLQGTGESEFFRDWYRNYGQAYFVVFRKNLRVTNIQYAELLALLRCHSHYEEPTHDPTRTSSSEVAPELFF